MKQVVPFYSVCVLAGVEETILYHRISFSEHIGPDKQKHMVEEFIRRKLLHLIRMDVEVRTRLEREGTLEGGYHPLMRAVHEQNAQLLDEMVEKHGWPGIYVAGADGAHAAFLIAQHAISLPGLQKRWLELMNKAAGRGEIEAWQPAMMHDRICYFENRPQRFGTQFDWDCEGQMSPWPLEEPEEVDARRKAIGLPPLVEVIARHRAALEGTPPPADWILYTTQRLDWARKQGWDVQESTLSSG